jgi:hypothetical protein
VRATLVVLLQSGNKVVQRKIFEEPHVGNYPVLRSAPPGVYEDIEQNTKIRVTNDVVILEHLESSTVGIALVQGKIRRLTLSD